MCRLIGACHKAVIFAAYNAPQLHGCGALPPKNKQYTGFVSSAAAAAKVSFA